MNALFLSQALLAQLLLRMVATAFIVMLVTWSVAKFGPLIGGAVAGLPITLGPGFFFLSQENPPSFIASAAAYAVLSLCATQFFLLAYMAAARRDAPFRCLIYALLAWIAAALVFGSAPPRPWLSAGLFGAATAVCWFLGLRLLPDVRAVAERKTGFWLLFLRGVIAGILVAGVTTTSNWIGPIASGFLLAFPISYTVMIVTIHQFLGRASVIATLHSIMLGTGSLAVFCTAMAVLVAYANPLAALAIAVGCSMLFTLSLAVRGQRAYRRFRH